MKSIRISILEQMAAIERMERGKLCAMRDGRHYNLQSWERGRNVVRYVPATEAASVKKDVAQYKRFLELVKRYADLVIQDTRKNNAKARSTPKRGSNTKI
jgi:hypothetical protein